MKLTALVQTCTGREASLQRTLASIEASDIEDYEVLHHPATMTNRRFFLSVLDRAIDLPVDYVLVLEDDVTVGRYIRHNILSWPAIEVEDFAAGWVFVPDGVADDTNRQLGKPPFVRRVGELHAACAMVFSRSSLPWLREGVESVFLDWGIDAAGAPGRDLAVSRVISSARNAFIYMHIPSLAEHRMDEASMFGHTHNRYHHSAWYQFDPDYRRSSPDELPETRLDF